MVGIEHTLLHKLFLQSSRFHRLVYNVSFMTFHATDSGFTHTVARCSAAPERVQHHRGVPSRAAKSCMPFQLKARRTAVLAPSRKAFYRQRLSTCKFKILVRRYRGPESLESFCFFWFTWLRRRSRTGRLKCQRGEDTILPDPKPCTWCRCH